MGRKKIGIEFVENRDARYVTFSKRKNGLFKKANELSILCNARVGIVGFTPAGNPFAFGSPTFLVVVDEYLRETRGESSRQNVEPSGNGNINVLGKELMGVTKELKKVETIDKGKLPIAYDDLDFDGLKKVKASLEELRADIDAASTLLLLEKKPM
jgi:hypothetical protein